MFEVQSAVVPLHAVHTGTSDNTNQPEKNDCPRVASRNPKNAQNYTLLLGDVALPFLDVTAVRSAIRLKYEGY